MILIYSVLIAVIAMIAVIGNMNQQRKRRRQALWAANWLLQLRVLLEMFPKHRGMANALLKGDESFKPLLKKLQQEVDAQLQRMQQLAKECGGLRAAHLPAPIEQQWLAIRQEVFNLPARKSFEMHTRLIAMVIERLEDDSLGLDALAHNFGQLRPLLAVLTRELPHIVESIGQARGIGTGVAAQRAGTVANRVNLKYLHGKTSDIISYKLVAVRNVISGYQGMDAVIDGAIASAKSFLDLLQRELIENATPNIAPEQFYQQGTAAIDAGFQLFDQLFPRWLQSVGLK